MWSISLHLYENWDPQCGQTQLRSPWHTFVCTLTRSALVNNFPHWRQGTDFSALVCVLKQIKITVNLSLIKSSQQSTYDKWAWRADGVLNGILQAGQLHMVLNAWLCDAWWDDDAEDPGMASGSGLPPFMGTAVYCCKSWAEFLPCCCWLVAGAMWICCCCWACCCPVCCADWIGENPGTSWDILCDPIVSGDVVPLATEVENCCGIFSVVPVDKTCPANVAWPPPAVNAERLIWLGSWWFTCCCWIREPLCLPAVLLLLLAELVCEAFIMIELVWSIIHSYSWS